ncbi:hypothetical protein GOODEAATRI_024843, partial [Goodea atripinnis]
VKPTGSPSPTSAEVWLFVAPALAIVVVLFSVTLVFCRRRLKKAQTALNFNTDLFWNVFQLLLWNWSKLLHLR